MPRPRTAPVTPNSLAGQAIASRLTDTLARLNLDDFGAAEYLGVPLTTLRKWKTGVRAPSAAVIRLLDILGMVEAFAPALHASFMPVGAGAHAEPSGRGEDFASESGHVEKSGDDPSTPSTVD